jgi:hypothetical protein
VKGRGSFETFDKSGDKTRDDKKRKDKKPGMLSGLFKRKDRKSKVVDDEMEEPEKVSEESTRSYTPPKSSSESLKDDVRSAKLQPGPQRHPSKLQKLPPPELSPVKETENGVEIHVPSPIEEEPKSSLRLVGSDGKDDPQRPLQLRQINAEQSKPVVRPPGQTDAESRSPVKGGDLEPVSASRSAEVSDISDQPRPEQRVAASSRSQPSPGPFESELKFRVAGENTRQEETPTAGKPSAPPADDQRLVLLSMHPQNPPASQRRMTSTNSRRRPQSRPWRGVMPVSGHTLTTGAISAIC